MEDDFEEVEYYDPAAGCIAKVQVPKMQRYIPPENVEPAPKLGSSSSSSRKSVAKQKKKKDDEQNAFKEGAKKSKKPKEKRRRKEKETVDENGDDGKKDFEGDGLFGFVNGNLDLNAFQQSLQHWKTQTNNVVV